jgi:hypothetical protein
MNPKVALVALIGSLVSGVNSYAQISNKRVFDCLANGPAERQVEA